VSKKILEIEPTWCKGCGICVAFCPKNALELVGERAQLKPGNACIACGVCEMHCPDYAIFIREEGE